MTKTQIIFALLIILFLPSCISMQNSSSVKIIQPPHFSCVEKDPNNIDSERYDELLAESPIPVFIMPFWKFADTFMLSVELIQTKTVTEEEAKSGIQKINILGMYITGHKVEEWPEEFIFINSALDPNQIMATYAHEHGHYLHRKHRCICSFGSDPVLRETHALIAELEFGWKYDLREVLKASVTNMGIYFVSENSNIIYKLATARVMKSEIWKRTLLYLMNLELDRLNEFEGLDDTIEERTKHLEI